MSRSTFGWCKCTTICSDSFFPNIGDMGNHFNSLWIRIILTSAFWNPLLITSIYVLCIMIVIDLWYYICPGWGSWIFSEHHEQMHERCIFIYMCRCQLSKPDTVCKVSTGKRRINEKNFNSLWIYHMSKRTNLRNNKIKQPLKRCLVYQNAARSIFCS